MGTFLQQNWGSLVGVAGFFVTTAGLVYAIRAFHAATKAEGAARDAKEEVLRLDTLTDIAAAIGILGELQRLHRARAWAALPERYAAAKHKLVSIRMARSDYIKSRESTITATYLHLSDFQEKVESVVASKSKPPGIVRLNNILAKEIDELGATLVGFRREIGRGDT